MPIRKEERAKYPRNWKEIRLQVLERAAFRCENCGVPNHVTVIRFTSDPKSWHVVEGMEAEISMIDGDHPAYIVLTVAHLDHDPRNCDMGNLRAWCQKCHNTYDARHRAEGIKRRRQLAAGQVFFAQATDDEYMADDGMHQGDGFNKVN